MSTKQFDIETDTGDYPVGVIIPMTPYPAGTPLRIGLIDCDADPYVLDIALCANEHLARRLAGAWNICRGLTVAELESGQFHASRVASAKEES